MRSRSRRLVVEDSAVLDLAAITRPMLAANGGTQATASLAEGGAVRARVAVDLDRRVMSISYPAHPGAIADTTSLVSTPQPFGGVRWWVSCPRCHARCRKLYQPRYPRAAFACRSCHRLDYLTQRISKPERWRLRSRRTLATIGLEPSTVIRQKPKWMRWRTFDRVHLRAQWFQLRFDEWSVARLQRFLGGLKVNTFRRGQ